MKNKRTKIILVSIVLVLSIGASVLFVKRSSVLHKKPTTQEQALQQAREYKPKGVCGAAATPAIHTSTGARYGFPSTCLPEGWEPEQKYR